MRLGAVARGDATHPVERTIIGLLKTEFPKLSLGKRQKEESKICDGDRSAKGPSVGCTGNGCRRRCFCTHTYRHWIARTVVEHEASMWGAEVRFLRFSAVCAVKGKGSPYSITERWVPELILVHGSQPAGDVSHKPAGRLPLLSAKPSVTLATLNRVRWVWTVCLRLLSDSVVATPTEPPDFLADNVIFVHNCWAQTALKYCTDILTVTDPDRGQPQIWVAVSPSSLNS